MLAFLALFIQICEIPFQCSSCQRGIKHKNLFLKKGQDSRVQIPTLKQSNNLPLSYWRLISGLRKYLRQLRRKNISDSSMCSPNLNYNQR